MRAEISIDMDNEAFGAGPGGELARILEVFAAKLRHNPYISPGESWAAMDINGNRVGALTIKGKRLV